MLRRLFRTNPSPRTRGPARARIVQSLAGLAAGVRQTRRGSFLIMVVGTLALLAVITVIYVAIGRSDSQTGAAAAKFTDRDDVPDRMRDYLAGIIADDLFDAVYLRERDENGDPVFRREAWDYPSSPFQAVLPDTGGTGDTSPTFVTVGDGADERFWFDPTGGLTGTDPWLASSRPTLLNIAGAAASESDPTQYYLERLDWMHMSNVAPDGMPVNLWNLRDQGWNATPWELRDNLTLFDGPALGRVQTLDYGGTAHDPTQSQARPFEWFARQVGAFHPEVDPDYGPADPEYMLYQYADADGDGFLDSRWFEMVLARDPSSPDDARWILAPDRLRYFFAVRIEDLSGRVNVNTATDSTLAPAMTDPYGFTAASIDLRRALTLQDAYADVNMQFGYDALEQPKGGGNQIEDYSGYDEDNAIAAGEKAYDAIRMVLDTGALPPVAGLLGLEAFDTGTGVEREFSLDPASGMINPYWGTYWKLRNNPSLGPTDYYELFAGFGPDGGAGMLGTGNALSGVGRAFTADSLLELLRFRGVNDSTERSPLEAVLGGRAAYADSGSDLARFSPLRDNRATSLERDGRFTLSKGGATFDIDAKAASAVDVRQILTTHSGARPIYSTKISEDLTNPGYPSAGMLDLDESDLRENIVELLEAGNLQKIFELYADALLPYSGDDNHWTAGAGARQSDTLYYGFRGPELALRTAAHMAINLMDAYDDDQDNEKKRPTARDVILVAGFSGTNTELRLPDDERLAPSNSDVLSPIVTMFGIEVQPFVTGAASYVMYTDTPVGAGGDNDGDPDNDPGNGNSTPITINGDIDADNEDFLFQCIAFQIHNPFNKAIDLTADFGQHYVQYGSDKFFKLVDADNSDAPISLGARTNTGSVTPNTRVAYYVDPDPDTIAQRWANVTGKTQQEERDRFDDWVRTQFGEGAFRVECHTDATFGTDVLPYFDELLQDGTDGGIVHLYRDDPDTTENVLVDRLRDPQRDNSLDRTLPPGNQDIDGADEDFEGSGGDNDGLTITRFTSIRRSDDPRGNSTEDPPLGALPAYCIESKSQSYLQNVLDIDGSADDSLKISDFRDPQGDSTAESTIDQQSDVNDAGARLAPATALPEDRGSDSPDKDTIRGNRKQRPFEGSAEFPPLYVEPHLNDSKFSYDSDGNGEVDTSTMRVADVLLPLGIGPHYSLEEGWTTLSEALSYALNYDDPGDPNGQDYKGNLLLPSVYGNAFDPEGNGHPDEPDITLLDTGMLRPEGFTPFLDRNSNGRFDPQFERRWGPGVPMVANLLDRITTTPVTYGSLRSPTHGQININTAPREVTRLLPGLSPPPNTDPAGNSLWWWGAGAPHDAESDIATTLEAFRDHLRLFPRDLAGGGTEVVNFRDWFDDPNAPDGARSLPPQNGFPPGYDPDENSRRGATGAGIVREGLGFHSLGEITYLRDWAFVGSGAKPYPHDIDRLGFDGVHVNREGVDPMTYDTDGDGIPNADGDDEIEDDFDERLAIASAVMNSASVRSDFFAVWFVVHGYSETDVSGLGDDDPLIPTVARRFVMVVDRSNVTEPGEKPRIVLFKEVPL